MDRAELVAQGQRTRMTILRAAASEFSTRGYEASSLSDIAAVFGKPKTALRHHFASKGELAIAVLDHQYAVWDRMIVSLRSSGQRGLPAALALLGAAIVDSLDEPYALATVHLLLNRPTVDVAVPSPNFSWFGVVESLIIEAQADGDLPEAVDTTATTRLIIDATFGAHQLQFKYMSQNGADRDFDALWENLLRGFGVVDARSVIDRVIPLDWR
jgi:AcrR family transcriptional regulator